MFLKVMIARIAKAPLLEYLGFRTDQYAKQDGDEGPYHDSYKNTHSFLFNIWVLVISRVLIKIQ